MQAYPCTYVHVYLATAKNVAGGKAPWALEPLPGLCGPAPYFHPRVSDCHTSASPCQVAGLLPLLQDAAHRPLTMLWPTDSALQALPPDRQAWLYHEDHRDKLAAILRGHVIRNIEVGIPPVLGPHCLPPSLPAWLQP